jgi:serine/threonine protein phosphatase PrpC
LTPTILTYELGGVESVNADYAAHWPVAGGHLYVVCDGINHKDMVAQAVSLFCRSLRTYTQLKDLFNKEFFFNDIGQAVKFVESECGIDIAFCMTIAVMLEEEVFVAHCGDCRLGYLTASGIDWKTVDDVPYFKLYKNGSLTRDMYLNLRHLVSCKIKTGKTLSDVKMFTIPTPEQGCLLLCSDGFWSEMENELVGSIEECKHRIKDKLPNLTKSARDNFSLILV